MNKRLRKLFIAVCTVIALTGYFGGNAHAQVFDDSEPGMHVAPENYILFAEGAHVWVDDVAPMNYRSEGEGEDANLFLNLNAGTFAQGLFRISAGLDLSAQQANGDTLFMRIRSSTENQQANLGPAELRAKVLFVDQSSNDDLSFRAQWVIPDEYHTGEWLDLALPLPEFTSQIALDSAKVGKNPDGTDRAEGALDDFMANWEYWGTWSNTLSTQVRDTSFADWREFNWNNVTGVGIYWDQDPNPEAPIDIDDVWIGNSNVDLSIAIVEPSPLTSLTAEEASTDSNIVVWDLREDVLSYTLYMSGNPITDLDDPGVFNLGTFKGEATEFKHKVFSPHPELASNTYYYAIAPGNEWGVINRDVSSSTATLTTSGEVMPYIFGLTDELENKFLDYLSNSEFPTADDLADFRPFELAGEPTEGAYKGPEDASAKVWIANGNLEDVSTLYIYAEVLDDDTQAAPPSTGESMAGTTLYPFTTDPNTWIPGIGDGEFMDLDLEWNYYLKDQLKLYFGTYFVDNFVNGTPNTLMSRGETPDYMLSLQPYFDYSDGQANFATGLPEGVLTRLRITEPSGEIEPDYSMVYYNTQHPFTFAPVFEAMVDGDGNYMGWKVFMGIDAQDLLAAVDESSTPIDSPFVAPADNEVKMMPLSMQLWDKDGEFPDEGFWWETPSTVLSYPEIKPGGIQTFANTSSIVGIGTVAIAGSDMTTSNEEIDIATPNEFALNQNYPNPFNPATVISFAIPASENVTLTVFNTLGQKVATLVNKTMSAGQHSVTFDAQSFSSGIYFYTLEAGERSITKKMTLIK